MKFKLKQNSQVESCPECGNNTEFVGHSRQVCEDNCEVWVECKCGYNPTTDSGDRYESVMGGLDEGNLRVALSCWNDAIAAKLEDQS